MDPIERHNPVPGARFVDPRVLAKVGSLELLARTVVDGFINGLHKAPYLGVSLDFAEHRGYTPGDDIRLIDWKVYGRTDRYYIKQFEADTNANFSVLLDVSRSMDFASHGLSKLDYSKFLAACLTYLAHRQRDRVGLVTFDREVVDRIPVSAKHFEVVLHALDRAKAGRPGHLLTALRALAEHFGRRGILVLISDLYEEPEAILDAVKPLRFRGNDLIVFHVLDPAELEFPFEEPSAFEDLESGDRVPVVPRALRAEYRQLVQQHIATLTAKFSEHRVDYALFDTGKPLDHALFSYLGTRQRLSRVR
ncbi:MAG: DUF58 domain-containing protein [Acidobacteria bacterium]|nr:DUF58 domain-containing protein [Acidobacteriota bacterium]